VELKVNICVIHGSPRKGNTYKAAKIFMEELNKNNDVKYLEYFVPKDMPHFCCGCYNCFEKGEDKCPHHQYTMPILNSIKEADGIILTTPVYVLGESGGMKALLDHYGFMYIPHRPMEEMFSKVAMVISTTAGAGAGHAIKTISRSLRYWGVKRIYSWGGSLFAKDWEDMELKKRHRFEKTLSKKAEKFYEALAKRKKLRPRIFTKLIFTVMKGAISKYSDGQPDKEYWKLKGWINGKSRPF
jgi:multimeric flavodoxin WrbA